MLSRSSQTSRTATIPAPGSLHPLQEYLSELQSKAAKDFPDVDEEDSNNQGEHEATHQVKTGGDNNGEPGFHHLVSNKDFSELFQQFFVVGHKKLVILRSKVFLNRDVSPDTLIMPSDINAHKIQILREQLYRLQMNLFQNPKGRQYDSSY